MTILTFEITCCDINIILHCLFRIIRLFKIQIHYFVFTGDRGTSRSMSLHLCKKEKKEKIHLISV
jgi:hypothetical protein